MLFLARREDTAITFSLPFLILQRRQLDAPERACRNLRYVPVVHLTFPDQAPNPMADPPYQWRPILAGACIYAGMRTQNIVLARCPRSFQTSNYHIIGKNRSELGPGALREQLLLLWTRRRNLSTMRTAGRNEAGRAWGPMRTQCEGKSPRADSIARRIIVSL